MNKSKLLTILFWSLYSSNLFATDIDFCKYFAGNWQGLMRWTPHEYLNAFNTVSGKAYTIQFYGRISAKSFTLRGSCANGKLMLTMTDSQIPEFRGANFVGEINGAETGESIWIFLSKIPGPGGELYLNFDKILS